MNPLVRTTGDDRAKWSRFDVAGYQTIYAAENVEAAYAEVLTHYKDPLGYRNATASLDDFFDNENQSQPGSFRAEIDKDWGFPTGAIPRGWREERLLYELRLPTSGWFVDLNHPDTLAVLELVLRHHCGGAHGIDDLTLSDTTGGNRLLTTDLAEWALAQVLDDGALPHGFYYPSKRGSAWPLWCVWLRKVHDGASYIYEETRALGGSEVQPCHQNPALANVVRRYNLVCH